MMMSRPLYAEYLLMSNPFKKGWAPCFQLFPCAKRDGAVVMCLETNQVREVPKRTIMMLDARRYLGGFEMYCYQLYLSINLQYYSVVSKVPLSWEEYKKIYCQKDKQGNYVDNRQTENISQL